MSSSIFLSIVIPVRNEEKFIQRTLESLVNQDFPRGRYELIVVDGRSTDLTVPIVQKFIADHPDVNIRLVDNPGILSSRARNIGIRMSKGQLIGVIDGHVYIPDNQLFTNMEKFKKETGMLCLARPAPLDVPDLDDGLAYWIAVARKSFLGHSNGSMIYSSYEGQCDPVSSGFAYDRSVFEKVGYFDESLDAAEDVEFHHRLKKAGIMAYTSPKLTIYYFPRSTFRDLFRQQERYGEGRARFVQRHISGLTWETPIPSLLFLFFLFLPGAVSIQEWFPLLSIIYTTTALAYWCILLGVGFTESIKRRRFFAGITIAYAIWIIHMGLGWGFLKTIVRPTANRIYAQTQEQ